MTKRKKRLPSEPLPDVRESIISIGGRRIIIDADLARLYGTSTKRLKEQLKQQKEDYESEVEANKIYNEAFT